ncbi:MAG TPA: hypothetical protein VHV55_13415 [Pirellulales bacterium]|jgi:hypothetical protein|nr:hypothetical protein [Pirellulales bacterium]
MVEGPIRVDLKSYNGADQKKYAKYLREYEAGRQIEDYLNSRYVEGQPQIFTYAGIGSALDIAPELVRRLLMGGRGGGSGITV